MFIQNGALVGELMINLIFDVSLRTRGYII
jgi:hypothetical protein